MAMKESSRELNSTHTLSRRKMLRRLALGASGATLAPFVMRRPRASSGELNVYAWDEYIQPPLIQRFESETGIKINLSTFGSNAEALNKIRAAGAEGFDIVFPSVNYLATWYQTGDLLQPIDETRVDYDLIKEVLVQRCDELGALRRGKRYAVPFTWGTEAIAFDSSERHYDWPNLSWANLWSEENRGLVTVRPRSALMTIGILLDEQGKVKSDRMMAVYQNEEEARRVFGAILEFAIEHKPWVRQIWNNAQEAKNAFYQNGCVIGQCWDGTTFKMSEETDGKIRYLAPKEGALAWLDTMAVPSGARNIDQAYAFINFVMEPKIGGIYSDYSGYNSAAKHAEEYTSEIFRKQFDYSYANGQALEDMWWWPASPAWLVKIREEYVDKFMTA